MQPNDAESSIGERQFDDCVLRETSQLHPRSKLADGLCSIHAASMDQTAVTATVNDLITKVATLEEQSAGFNAVKVECEAAITALIARIEALQAENAELTTELDRARTTMPVPQSTPYRKRPAVMRGRTVQKDVGCGPLYVTLNEDEAGRPFEVFFKLGKSGSCQQSYLEALGVSMSVGLRYGADPRKFVDKLEGMRCPNPLSRVENHGRPGTLSCADAISQGIAQALALALPGTEPQARREAQIHAIAEPQPTVIDLLAGQPFGPRAANGTVNKAMQTGVGICPKCSGPLVSQGGCVTCLQGCGYEKCS